MVFSKHCRERYVERIVGITDLTELRHYMNSNEDKITDWLNKLFEHAQFVFRGQIAGDKTTKNFYVNGDIALVVSDDQCVVTLYRIDYKFPPETNKKVLEDLITEIRRLDEEIAKESESMEKYIEEKKLEEERLDFQIKNLKEQVALLEIQRDSVKGDIQAKNSKRLQLYKELERFANMMFSWPEFKKDLLKA